MINFKPKLPALLGALAVLTAGAAHAELLEYTFKAPNGAQRSLPPNANYANPTGNVSFALSAGIDRKVKISVLRSDGTVVSTATSHLLGATDRITVGGKSYYGAELQLPAPVGGAYTVRAEILASDGSTVQMDQYPLTVDVTPPTYSSLAPVYGGYGQVTSGDVWKLGLGGSEDNAFLLSGISDESPIKGVKAKLYRQDGSLYKDVSVNYDDANGQARQSFKSGFFPASDLDEVFTLQFEISDSAGNSYLSPRQKVMFDSITNAPSAPFGVYDPSSTNNLGPGLSGFVAYTAGMTVKTNPIRLAWRVPRDNWHEYREGGINMVNALGEMTKVGEDGNYVYLVTTSPFGNTDGNYWRWGNFGAWGGGGISYSLTLSPSAPQSPRLLGVDYNYSDIGWSSFYRYWVNNSVLPVTVSSIRVKVEPRPYVQTAVHRGSCEVPVGQDSCVITNSFTMEKGTTGYVHDNVTVYNTDKSLSSNPMWAEVNWNDQHYPQLSQQYDQSSKVFTLFVNQPGRGAYFDRLRLRSAWIEDSKGNKLSPTGGLIANNWENYTYQWDLKTLPEGQYSLVAAAEEMHGPLTRQPMFQITSDRTAPTLTISVADGAAIQTLDDVVITLADAVDPSPKLTSLALVAGPANDKVQLSWREESKGRFRLEYPVMFPSLKEGESYSLTVAGEDAQGNAVQKAVGFEYKPRQVMLADGMDGKVMIPAVTHEFVHADGKRIIETKPLTLSDGAVVTGSYDVFATLRSDAQVPLVVNGVRIEPGQTMGIMSQHDFGASGGRLSIPVKPAVPDEVGSSSLLVMTSAPNSPILVVDINTWKGAAKLSAESWTIRQVIDPVKIYALPELGVPCRFTTKADVAMAADPIRDPVCLLQWDRTPDEAEQTTQDNNGMKVAGLVGQAVSIGEQPVEYSLYLFSGDGSKVKVGSGSQNLTVTTAYDSVGYSPIDDIAQVNRVIEDFDVNFKQSKGPDCSITLSADRAKNEAAKKGVGSTSRTCLFEWQQIPDGLVQDQLSESPSLSGSLAANGDHPLGWRVSIFTRNGTRVTLNDEIFNIEAVDPPAPTVALSSKYNFKNNIYMVPMTGNYLGDVIINSERAALDISISRNSSVLESETFSPGSGAYNKVYRRINTDERPLWEETTYKVNATYNKVPDVKTEVVYKAIAAPSDSIRPIVEVEGDTAIDTQALPIKVLIRDQYKPDGGYDEKTMGKWKVRLIRQKVYNETEPLTDFVFAENGEAQFSVNIKGVDSSSIRIVAEAVLESPVEGYNRTETSLRPAFLTVLKGGAIGADVQSRKLSGQAPFTSVFKLALNDRQDVRATGKVIWETSADDGKTWEQFTPEDRYKYQLVRTFEKGEYKVRAKVFNINSGAEQYTEVVSIIAYDKPKISVSGPATLFIGSEGQYIANLTLNDEEIKDSDAIVEWSTDGGKTYSETGKNITLSSDEVTRYRLWSRVRSISAPPDDSYAYETSKMSVDFVAVKPPRPRVTGPSLIETGKVYTFKAETSLPYRGMEVTMNGFFTLPNGTIVNGDTLEYTPTESDLSQNNIDIKYTVWIEGYREKGAEASHSLRTRVWQYVWPKFGMQVRVDASVAPATVTASVRAIAFNGKLEDPTYDWDLPKGVIIEDQKQGTLRSFVVNEPGDYTIKVNIRDARGHEFVIEQPLKVGQAAPYVVDLQYSGSNPFEREPLDVLLRPYVSGGHPKDRIASRLFSVNGTLIDGGGYYVRTRLGAGEHSIKLKITSEMGHEAEGEVNINVAENKLPACSLSSRETVGSWIVYASCEDTDGRMKSYEWTIAGELQSISSDRVTISKGTYEAMPTISLVGIDDSGGRSEAVTMN
ncbi:Ig-like domain-containing protein [Shewanella oncorhynchi]|uniref:Ig-like domain-containing protein n=1 Tax=Shewanella oncorhynchi TaxID=2726434 RepID=UPI003D7A83D5